MWPWLSNRDKRLALWTQIAQIRNHLDIIDREYVRGFKFMLEAFDKDG